MRFISWEKNRLSELVDLWNKELRADFPMRPELFEQNSFQDVNLFKMGSQIVVNDEDGIIGFVVAKKWQDDTDVGISRETGWIQVLLVDSNYRGRGIGKQLLQHAESALKECGVKRVLIGMDTWHYFPGVPLEYADSVNWFERQGYKKGYIAHDLDCHYEQNEGLSLPEIDDVEFTILREQERQTFLSFLKQCFPGRWEYEAMQYFDKGGTGREFVVAKKRGEIIGFCRINDAKSPIIAQNVYWAPSYENELGGIGPLGIDANERKNRYGLSIVKAAVYYLRKRNIFSIVIDWTELIKFYNKLGFEVCKSYQSYEKQLD
ncbi:GNAT family N-acetyltransferase [Radiobacillus sp. PE A8.2]|uniref:GNAT family N-acetyltransferase n=1 Tax=Radiobacillus sp. PE A8.2 TaxID=3380349 RepID=UPI0038901DFF